ncbi:MAG: phosphotransferase family protein, partial [Steroidobacteraceae bacterium]
LDHLIVREERLAKLLQPHLQVQQETLKILQQTLSHAGHAPARSSGGAMHRDGALDVEDVQCGVAEQLEHDIAAVLPLLRTLPEAEREGVWQSIKKAVLSESELHTAIEQEERAVAAVDSKPQQAATEVTPERLQAYLRKRSGSDDVEVVEIAAELGGYSKDTFIVKLRGPGRPADDIVIRRDLPQGPLEESVTIEFAVLKAMYDSGVRVAEPLWVETDSAALGRPFMVVKKVPGKQPVNVKLEVASEGGTECVRQLAQILAKIHSVDPRLAGVSDAEASEPTARHILKMLDRYEGQWRRRRMGPSPVIAAAFAWMRNNIPPHLPSARIIHGDPTVRNMLFHEGEATALLDWETWHLGDPAEDVVYSRIDVDRFLPWEEYLAEYRRNGGAEIEPQRLRYWEMWLYLRGAVTSISMMDRLEVDPPPDIRPAFGGPHFTRMCVRKVADIMQTL